jgi:hypothetical protein
MNGPRRLLLGGLVAVLAVLELHALLGTVLIPPRFAVDLEIPLRAAERWLAGGAPYLAEGFTSPPGATQPFLYPPYTLPFFAVLTNVPRPVIGGVVVGLLLMAAVGACRRLSIPWIWIPLVLAWPPFAEAIFGANIQMALFAALVFLFYRPSKRPWEPVARDVEQPAELGVFVGGLATLIGAIKVSQPHAWLFVLRHRPRAAIGGAIAIALLAAASLVFTGVRPGISVASRCPASCRPVSGWCWRRSASWRCGSCLAAIPRRGSGCCRWWGRCRSTSSGCCSSCPRCSRSGARPRSWPRS